MNKKLGFKLLILVLVIKVSFLYFSFDEIAELLSTCSIIAD